MTTLIAGIVSYIGGLVAGVPYPFLLSLATSLATYAAVGVREAGGVGFGRPAPGR